MATSSQPTPLPFSRDTQAAPRGTAEVESLAATRGGTAAHDRLRELSRAELDDLVADLADRPNLWRHTSATRRTSGSTCGCCSTGTSRSG